MPVGMNFKGSTKLSERFSHTSNANSGSTGGSHLLLLFGRDAFAPVCDLDRHLLVALTKSNLRARTSRMAMNICKAFLNHAQNGGLRFARQAPKVLREIEIHFDLAADSKAFDIPAEGGRQAGFIEQRGMQQVRYRTDLAAHLPDQIFAIR